MSEASGEAQRYLRERAEHETPVSFIELFFDLVYVFAVTQLSHLLLSDLTWHGAFRAVVLLLEVWQAWMYTAWMTNWFDPETLAVRAVLIGAMLVSLVVSANLPGAFGPRGMWFAVAYVVMQLGRAGAVLWICRDHPTMKRNSQRVACWFVASGVAWITGASVHGGARELVWLGALIIDNVAPMVGFVVPRLGASGTTDWEITGSHLAERCHQFVIIALGESITVTGATFATHPPSATALGALIVAFAGSAALWWIYFDRAATSSASVIAEATDPTRLGRTAYTYLHIPMVAGIIVAAVADELTVAHPTQHTEPAAAVVILLGPALFLAGHMFFKRTVFEAWSTTRLAAIAALALLAAAAPFTTTIALAGLATLVVVAVAARDSVREALPPPPATSCALRVDAAQLARRRSPSCRYSGEARKTLRGTRRRPGPNRRPRTCCRTRGGWSRRMIQR